ncbi:RNA-binding protein [Brucella phage BiPBO1]|uniref:ASCH domain-containing protein n=1 Tax=Brucella phage BiPBO1 TaxID=1718278 RepID=UPI00046D201D|nr:ASCH domain-containing protein [Brucella inopinata]YP_009304076.1 ASCH domain-containing protein [Brucella phage BiPBO1]ALJ98262.1 RNA-binding protein [Brucella phage BiPBO1]KEY03798.1 RNA-binding protein [Brucella suis bv. 4 str. 40]
MRKLTLPLKAEYFDAIRDGTKTEEYRLANAYWTRRLHNMWGSMLSFDGIVLARGYPKRDDAERRLELPWRGFTRKTITHPHFGPDPVEVFAIDVSGHPSGGDRHGE